MSKKPKITDYLSPLECTIYYKLEKQISTIKTRNKSLFKLKQSEGFNIYYKIINDTHEESFEPEAFNNYMNGKKYNTVINPTAEPRPSYWIHKGTCKSFNSIKKDGAFFLPKKHEFIKLKEFNDIDLIAYLIIKEIPLDKHGDYIKEAKSIIDRIV